MSDAAIRLLKTLLPTCLIVICGQLVGTPGSLGVGPSEEQENTTQESTASEMPPALLKYLKSTMDDDTLSMLEDANFRPDRYDVNGDGVREYFVVGFCSPTGNCELWVIQKGARGYRTLLQTSMAHIVCVRETRNAGYRDLEIRSHGSAFDSDVRIYRFNGEEYEEAESYSMRWEHDDKTGKSRQVEGPTKRIRCHELFTQYSYPPPRPRTTPPK